MSRIATCVACGRVFARADDETWKVRCRACWLAAKDVIPTTGGEASAILDNIEAHLRLLIQLCHPDRHGGSAAANDATVWLIGLRERIAQWKQDAKQRQQARQPRVAS